MCEYLHKVAYVMDQHVQSRATSSPLALVNVGNLTLVQRQFTWKNVFTRLAVGTVPGSEPDGISV